MWYAILSVSILLSVVVLGAGCQAHHPPRAPMASAPPAPSRPVKPPERPRITNAIVGLPTPPPTAPHPVRTDTEAIAFADALLVLVNADWGRPSVVQKTGEGFYRIEYGEDARGVARVVLVNGETSRASFPLPR